MTLRAFICRPCAIYWRAYVAPKRCSVCGSKPVPWWPKAAQWLLPFRKERGE